MIYPIYSRAEPARPHSPNLGYAKRTPTLRKQKTPIRQVFVRSRLSKSGRPDSNRRPPEPHSDQGEGEQRQNVGFSRESGRRCRTFPTCMSHFAGRNAPPNAPPSRRRVANRHASADTCAAVRLPPGAPGERAEEPRNWKVSLHFSSKTVRSCPRLEPQFPLSLLIGTHPRPVRSAFPGGPRRGTRILRARRQSRAYCGMT